MLLRINDGSFSVNLPEGRQILYVNLADFDQAVIEADVKSGETVDAGKIILKASAGSLQDLFTININEGVSEDGFETQSVQGVLSASADIFLSNAAYTFGPLMFRVRGYESNYSNVSINGFVVNDIESGAPYYSNWGGLNDVMRSAMVPQVLDLSAFSLSRLVVNRINTRLRNTDLD